MEIPVADTVQYRDDLAGLVAQLIDGSDTVAKAQGGNALNGAQFSLEWTGGQAIADVLNTPDNHKQAMKMSNSADWQAAEKLELDTLTKMGCWEVVDTPKNTNIVGCRWVYAQKLNELGELVRLKARLVAKGYSQRENEDYFKTHSPVVRMESIRWLISVALQHELSVRTADVTAAYLCAKLDEKVYMTVPEGMTAPPDKVLLLRKSLYGLTQSGRNWFQRLVDFLSSIHLTQSSVDPCLFYINRGTDILFVLFHVDDIMTLAKPAAISRFEGALQKEFKVNCRDH